METPPNLQVYDLGHLGLVASVLGRIRLVQTVDRLVGPRPGEKVSTGMALKAAILNALGSGHRGGVWPRRGPACRTSWSKGGAERGLLPVNGAGS